VMGAWLKMSSSRLGQQIGTKRHVTAGVVLYVLLLIAA
jgi:hypothetical protein